jgi:hypothetical protein
VEANAMSAPESKRARRWRLIIVSLMGAAMAIAGIGFSLKVHDFLEDWLSDAGIGFAGSHLLTYGLVAIGFFCLLGFAFLKGHFARIEEPKHAMLAREIERDARGEL